MVADEWKHPRESIFQQRSSVNREHPGDVSREIEKRRSRLNCVYLVF